MFVVVGLVDISREWRVEVGSGSTVSKIGLVSDEYVVRGGVATYNVAFITYGGLCKSLSL